MNQRIYFLLTAVVFAGVAGAHLLRAVFGWDATIAGCPASCWCCCPRWYAAGAGEPIRQPTPGRSRRFDEVGS